MSASVYIHLNPVRTKRQGLGKGANRAESRGLVAMDREAVQRRLKALRAFRWSSYGAYAGYGGVPEWLTVKELLDRCGGQDAYRKHVQQHVTRGDAPEGYGDFGGQVALGSQAFLGMVKGWVGRLTKEQPDREQVLKRVSPAEVIKVVERVRGEPWAEFADRHGDSGRDLALYLARRRSGLTLGDLGREFGIAEYKTVAAAIKRFELSLAKDSAKRKLVERCIRELQKVET
jgi:hypothetical protein